MRTIDVTVSMFEHPFKTYDTFVAAGVALPRKADINWHLSWRDLFRQINIPVRWTDDPASGQVSFRFELPDLPAEPVVVAAPVVAKLPMLELRRVDNGGVIVVDENLMIIASFMTQTPNLHLRGQSEGVTNFDASINMDAAKWFIAECQKRWATPSYARFFTPPS